MAAPEWDDLNEFVSLDDFGQKVVFMTGGTMREVVGIFDEAYLNADIGEFEMDSTEPRLNAKESDLIGIQRGDTVMIDGALFDVMAYPQTDGNGFAVVKLSRVNA